MSERETRRQPQASNQEPPSNSNFPHGSFNRRNVLLGSTALAAVSAAGATARMEIAQAQQQRGQPPLASGRKPNILMIMADDIGWFNVSLYNHGMMGYRRSEEDTSELQS